MNFAVNIYASASRTGMNSNPEFQAEQMSESAEQSSPQPGQSHLVKSEAPGYGGLSSPLLCRGSALSASSQENL